MKLRAGHRVCKSLQTRICHQGFREQCQHTVGVLYSTCGRPQQTSALRRAADVNFFRMGLTHTLAMSADVALGDKVYNLQTRIASF